MGAQELQDHLRTGVTTTARVWQLIRADGGQYGFTDHDRDLEFGGQQFRADTGLSAGVLAQSSGLSVDNTEALGALTDAALNEKDIIAGRFDGAEVVAWLVNWRDVSERKVVFRGSIGEIRRVNGAFHAELRGLSEMLNRPMGRAFQKADMSIYADDSHGIDLTLPEFMVETPLLSLSAGRVFVVAEQASYDAGWFERGVMTVVSGTGAGLKRMIKRDYAARDGSRVIEIWDPLRFDLAVGDLLRLTAGNDGRFDTWMSKFGNAMDFKGFPDLPSEDWLASYPNGDAPRDGGSRR